MEQTFETLLESLDNSINQVKESNIRRLKIKLTKNQFLELFTRCAKIELIRLGYNEFILDEYNKPVMNQLYLWLTYDNDFEGDLDKGIMLCGAFGVGKTIIMESFISLYNNFADKNKIRIHRVLSRGVSSLLNEENMFDDDIIKHRAYIDDIGKESLKIMRYGNEIKPIPEYLYRKAYYNIITFGSTNYKLDSLIEMYGGSIGDRFNQLFNFIELKGKSKR